MGKYNGDIILTKRFSEYYEDIAWNENPITDEMVKYAIENGVTGEPTPYGNTELVADWVKIVDRSDEWHVARIIYFINNPYEIRDIWVDNKCYHGRYPGTSRILPIPFITDGHHRYRAVAYLGLDKFHCQYSGRMDLLAYLTGENDVKPIE